MPDAIDVFLPNGTLDRGQLAEARTLLRKSLKLRWGAGLRASTADTLEALAETTWRLGDAATAKTMLEAACQLRDETGLARQPIYAERYRRLEQEVGFAPGAEPLDLDAAGAAFLGAERALVPGAA